MFKSSNAASEFQKALEKLARASDGKSPKTLNASVQRILERCHGFQGSTIDELIHHIIKPSKKMVRSKSCSTQTTKSKLKAHSPKLVTEIVVALQKVEKDQAQFSKLLNSYSKSSTAVTMKQVAAQYASSSKPKTKVDAKKLINSARASRVRAELKQKESAAARPW